MKYPWYLKIIDAFGFFALLMTIWHIVRQVPPETDSRLDGVLGNLSTELLGIYISVRLIDFVVRSYQEYRDARISTVRNMRNIENLLHGIEDFKSMRELRIFNMEFDWFKVQIESRKKHLKNDEVEDIRKFTKKLDEILSSLPAVDLSKIGEKISVNSEIFAAHFVEVENLRIQAERNILNETSE